MIEVLRGTIYLADLPMPSSFFNQFKIRPVIVIQNDLLNMKREDTIIIPISSNLKHSSEETNYTFEDYDTVGLKVKSVAICSSIFTIPQILLKRKIGVVSEEVINALIEKINMSIT